MARRNDHSKEQLREMAIAAGQKIIDNEGVSKFSARKVASEIGYTPGTIYNVFGSHDELMLNINAAILDDMKEFITRRLDKSRKRLSDAARIKQLAACYLEYAKKHHECWSILFEHRLSSGVSLPGWYLAKLNDLFSMVEQPLLRITGDEEKAGKAAKTIWAGIHGICTLGLSGKLDVVGAESVQVLMDDLVDSYIKGIVK